MRVQMQKQWKPEVVTEKWKTPRSYVVQASSGQKIRRNRYHLRKCEFGEPTTREPIEESQKDQAGIEGQTRKQTPVEASLEYRTRSGHASKPPERFQAGYN